MVDFAKATQSARARRRGEAGKTGRQGSIDDFLGGGGAVLAPAPVKDDAPEPGGWVTDKSGVETYADASLPKVDAVARGDSDHTLVGEDAREMQRRIDAEAAKVRPVPAPPPMRPGELDAALSAPRKGGVDLPSAYGRIVRTTFAFDPDKVFDELNDKLKFKKPLRDMGYIDLAEALDDAARAHVDASRLHAHSKVTLAEFDADCEAMRGDMRAQATAQLKAEKEEKGGKQITDSDVTARMATLFPDEYRRQERLKAQAKATIGHLETLVKVWELRRRELDTMLRECRKGA